VVLRYDPIRAGRRDCYRPGQGRLLQACQLSARLLPAGVLPAAADRATIGTRKDAGLPDLPALRGA